MKQSYTSGETARLCGLGISTVKRWIKRGALKAYRTPGGDLRIRQDHLVDFMQAYDIPLHQDLTSDMPRSLLIAVDHDKTRAELEARTAAWGEALSVTVVADDLDLGYSLATAQPSYVILEARDPEADAERLHHIRHMLTPRPVRIALVSLSPMAPARLTDEARPEITSVVDGQDDWSGALLRELVRDLPRSDEQPTRRAG